MANSRQRLYLSIHAGVIQLVECQLPKLDVAGSSPVARSPHSLSPARCPVQLSRTLDSSLPDPAARVTGEHAAAPPAPTPPSGRYDRSIVSGPLSRAVWKIAWPTMLTNIIGGAQGIIDHVMVGHYVGFAANAGIGVAGQIMIIVIIFITSLFTGMSVLVARFAGAGDEDKVDKVVYQALITAIAMSLAMAAVGYFAAPALLSFVNAEPAVRAEALPYLRIMFLFSLGMLLFFMLSGALRSAGDARTPMVLGIAMTVLNIGLNVVLIRGLGPIPAYGTAGAAMGTVIASSLVVGYALVQMKRGGWVVSFPKRGGYGPDWGIIKALFRFGLPTGIRGSR